MKKIRLRIDGQEDRRQLCAILADNGHNVVIKKEGEFLNQKYFIVIEVEK